MHTFVKDRRKTICLPTTGDTSMQPQNPCVGIKTITGYVLPFQTNRFLNFRQSKNAVFLSMLLTHRSTYNDLIVLQIIQ